MAKYTDLRPDNSIGSSIQNEVSTYLDPDEYTMYDANGNPVDAAEYLEDYFMAMGNALSGITIELDPEIPSYTGVMVPMYIYPSGGISNTTYNNFIDLKKIYHNVPTIVILNPNNGPGTVVDGNFTITIKRLHGAGCKVVGYVSTAYMANDISDVTDDVNTWYSLYPSIDGIFFDELAWSYPISQSVIDYYIEARDNVRSHTNNFVIMKRIL